MSFEQLSTQIPENSVVVEATGSVNIACIKYWGKRDVEKILPTNSSLSGTIDPETMCSRTVVIASKSFEKDQMFLNDKEEDIAKNKRLVKMLKNFRERAQDYVVEGKTLISKADWADYRIRIVSKNNFPTAAGLASSASGYACLTFALANLFNFQEQFPGELTIFARQGSGSACRSLYGGWVKWEEGKREDGQDSLAVQVADEKHWPEMRVLILVANSGEKEVGSTDGMQRTVATSPLLKYRCEHVVPKRIAAIEEAIKNKDFQSFARITMEDSNQFHAVCLDTFPPIFYMNETSKRIVELLNQYNEACGRLEAAYTYDAGPNCVIYTLAHNVQPLMTLFSQYFFQDAENPAKFVLDSHKETSMSQPDFNLAAAVRSLEEAAEKDVYARAALAVLKKNPAKRQDERLFQMIVSRVGKGCQLVRKNHTFSS